MPMLEKFGIYSPERKAELLRISNIAREQNRIKDTTEFSRIYTDYFNYVDKDLTTEYAGEIILNKFKILNP